MKIKDIEAIEKIFSIVKEQMKYENVFEKISSNIRLKWLDESIEHQYTEEEMTSGEEHKYSKMPGLFRFKLKAPKYMRYHLASTTETLPNLSVVKKEVKENAKRGLIPVSPRMFPNMPKENELIEANGHSLYICANKGEIAEEIEKQVRVGIEESFNYFVRFLKCAMANAYCEENSILAISAEPPKVENYNEDGRIEKAAKKFPHDDNKPLEHEVAEKLKELGFNIKE